MTNPLPLAELIHALTCRYNALIQEANALMQVRPLPPVPVSEPGPAPAPGDGLAAAAEREEIALTEHSSAPPLTVKRCLG